MNVLSTATKHDYVRRPLNMAKKNPWDAKAHFRAPKDRDLSCPTGKVRFKDHDHAVSALHKAKNRRALALENEIETPRQECRAYKCKACKGFHLTSKADFTKAA
ncbi:MAG: hypothetical protein RJA41_615 [Actinomycetota bacterium]